MPSRDLGPTIKWYERYWMRQYLSNYAPADALGSDSSIAKDSFKYIRESKRLKKTEDERKTMINDIKYFRMRWGKIFKEHKFNPKDPKLNEKVLGILLPQLKEENKI